MAGLIVILVAVAVALTALTAGLIVLGQRLLRKPRSSAGLGAAGPTEETSRGSGPAPPVLVLDSVERMLIDPDYSFARIRRCFRRRGFLLDDGLAEDDESPTEPARASFRSGSVTATYAFDPGLRLRQIELHGPTARDAYMDLLNGAYIPALQGFQIGALLKSSDPTEVTFGLHAAEFTGFGRDLPYFVGCVEPLTAHPSSDIAARARRVHDLLLLRQAAAPAAES